MPDPELTGWRILVTRPPARAQRLIDGIRYLGGEAICLPLLAIRPVQPDSLPDLANTDLLLFVSATAVEYALPCLGRLPDNMRLGAIGQGTATQLQRAGLQPSLVPARADSEGLLALTELQDVSGQRVVIVRGRGGRETLASGLQARGARVSYLEVYERYCPVWQADDIAKALQADIITVTSGEAVDNLAQLARLPGGEALWSKPLLAYHVRIAAHAQELGFTLKPAVSEKPGDESMLTALLKWVKQHKGMERA